MLRTLTVAVIVAVAGLSGRVADRVVTQSTGTDGAVLFHAFGNRVYDDRLPAVLASLAPDVRLELVRRLARREMYVSQTPLPPASAGFESWIVIRNRRSMEVGMVALLETRNMPDAVQAAIEHEAAEYARDAKLSYEWEGFQDGPFGEGADAVAYLAAHPRSELRPYLDLFVLHRYRSAFEAAGWEAAHAKAAERNANLADQHRAAALYKELWLRLSVAADPVVRAVAIDLDRATHVYVDIQAHPRTYGG